ncbi:energy transducer TonB [Pedobacter frigoris]|uniref:energy transducer TonB n=1 Tax=Pedobacter frigoris TaxID=2571272 RepID=UPI00292E0DA8|nr:energy transducer TonB [Pedobacter frigoris]
MRKILLVLFLLYGFTVQAQPKLKGSLESFVANNKVYPQYSLQNCIQGTVTISFKLNKEGEVYYSKIRNGIGTDLDDEALRLIRMSSGKWIMPAGHDTTVSIIAPIKFSITSEDCGNRSREQIAQAIQAYRSNEGMTSAVLNFYKNKEQGKAFSPDEEAKIKALKGTLGYDNAYFNQRIADGMKKLKQKDKQGACEDFLFVKHMGSDLADEALAKYCN